VEEVEDQEYVAQIKASYVPVQVTEGLWIIPDWSEPVDLSATNIILTPGVAFGTGELLLHPYLCMHLHPYLFMHLQPYLFMHLHPYLFMHLHTRLHLHLRLYLWDHLQQSLQLIVILHAGSPQLHSYCL
jgi:hypothetical protein